MAYWNLVEQGVITSIETVLIECTVGALQTPFCWMVGNSILECLHDCSILYKDRNE